METCVQSFVHGRLTMVSITKKHMSSRFSSNSEAKASELLENHEEMYLQY